MLALLLVFVHNINTYYWMLTALVAQTFLIMYLLMYVAVVRLRVTKPDAPRPFKIPGGKIGLGLVVGAGVVGALFAFFLGFVPATHLSLSGTLGYVGVMAFGIILIVVTPFLLHRGPAARTDTQVDPNLDLESQHGRGKSRKGHHMSGLGSSRCLAGAPRGTAQPPD